MHKIMPEKPEVARTAECLHKYLENTQLATFEINSLSRYHTKKFQGYESLIPGLLLISVYSRGKKIVFNFGDIKMVISLGLEGKFLREPGKHSGIHFQMAGSELLDFYIDDSRHFLIVAVSTNETEFNYLFKDVGPDIMYDSIEFESYSKIIQGKRIRNKCIYTFLMDQKYFSGLGNYLVSEVLYRCQISPFRTLGSLTETDISQLLSHSINTTIESYNCHGKTIATYKDPDGTNGTFNTQAYGHTHDLQGHKVIKDKFTNGRTCHWCPDVQK